MRDLLLRVLLVPPEPEPPAGSPDSIRVFRASPNLYYWNLLNWGSRQLVLLIAMVVIVVLGVKAQPKLPSWARLTWSILQGFLFTFYLLQLAVTGFKQKLDYQLRWYMVTDRSLRIRSGIFFIREMTMTFANLQKVSVEQGPLQKILGIADVEVSSAGGGAGAADPNKGAVRNKHAARFEGVSNAAELRDLILARVKKYRDAGLGDPDDHHEDNDLDAAREVLAAVRGLAAVLKG